MHRDRRPRAGLGTRCCAATRDSSPVSRAPPPGRRAPARARRRPGAARCALRLRRLAAGRRDHLRPGPRRPVRRAQRRPGHLRLGRSARSSTPSRVLTCRSSSCSATTSAAPCAPPSTPRRRRRRAAAAHLAPDRADRARPCAGCAAQSDAGVDRRAGRRGDGRAASTCATPSPSCCDSLGAHQRRRRRRTPRDRRRELPARRGHASVPDIIVGWPTPIADRHEQRPRRAPARNERNRSDRHRVPHRARHDGRGAGARARPVRRADAARRRELPDLRAAPRAGPDRGARPHQEGRRARERELGVLDARIADAIAARGRRGHRRRATTTSSRSTSTRPARARRRT